MTRYDTTPPYETTRPRVLACDARRHDHRTAASPGAPGSTLTLAQDKALLYAWCGGDKAAGERLIRYHFDWISRAVLRWVHGDTAAAMDIVQASFEIALQKKATIHGPFGPYLRGIARVKVLEHFRRHDGRVDALHSAVRSDLTGAESVLLGAEQQRLVLEALRQLADEPRELMILRHIEGMKLREIAELTGMTVSRVDGILRRAEQRLAREVERLARSPRLAHSTLLGVRRWLRLRGYDTEPDPVVVDPTN